MTDMVVRRPLLSLYLAPDSSVAPSGDLLPFWSRFVVAFTQRAGELQHVVALTIAEDPAAALEVPAQGFVIAETTGEAGVRPQDIAFGQLLVAPRQQEDADGGGAPGAGPTGNGGGGAPGAGAVGSAGGGAWSSRLVVDFRHDAAAIARDAVAALAASGVREALVVRRPGVHDYVRRITAHLQAAAAEHGIDLTDPGAGDGGQGAVVTPAELAQWLAGRAAPGVLAFAQAPAVRAGIAAAGRQVAATPDDGGVVLMLQGEAPMVRTDAAMFLSMQGEQAGRIVAESVVRALATGETVTKVLPHCVIR
jgi:hypothetical protein